MAKLDIFKLVKRYRVLLGILTLVIVALGAWYFSSLPQSTPTTGVATAAQPPQQTSSTNLLISSVLAGLATSLIGFLAVSWLFSKEDQSLNEELELKKNQKLARTVLHEASAELDLKIHNAVLESFGTASMLSEVPWARLIEGADEIDFIVQGWDGWFETPEIAEALLGFFERNGKLRLYLYDADSIESQRVRQDMAKRIGRLPERVEHEIKETYERAVELRDRAGSGSVELHSSVETIWYFGALFKGRQRFGKEKQRDIVLFSIYAHTSRRPMDMPAILIYPDMQQNDFREWFKKELDYLVASSGDQPLLPFDNKPAPTGEKIS